MKHKIDFLNILENEKKNGLTEEIYENAKSNFLKRLEQIDFKKYHLENAFLVEIFSLGTTRIIFISL